VNLKDTAHRISYNAIGYVLIIDSDEEADGAVPVKGIFTNENLLFEDSLIVAKMLVSSKCIPSASTK
jgi:hypothetical protein